MVLRMDDTTSPIAATAAPHVIGEARNYDELLDLLKRRRDQLGVSLEVVETVAGLTQRYVGKLFSPTKIKAIGPISMGPLLGALCLKLLVAIDQEQYERLKSRLTLRKATGSSEAFRRKHRRTHAQNCEGIASSRKS